VQELAEELDSGRVLPVELDIRDGDRVDAVVDDVVEKLCGVDVLFNNAGVSDQFTPAADTSDELWDSVVGVNLIGPFRLARRVLPSMIARGGGAIVNTGSVASVVGGAGGVAYTVSKHGILGLTRSLAIDYGSKGVRVNAVLPGAIRTGLTSNEDALVEGADDAIAATPAGRWAEPEEVAKIAVFLASDDASFIYGSAYTVDGGWSLP
jgi:3-oxoacyl-[acyl-carrier protein] reductase